MRSGRLELCAVCGGRGRWPCSTCGGTGYIGGPPAPNPEQLDEEVDQDAFELEGRWRSPTRCLEFKKQSGYEYTVLETGKDGNPTGKGKAEVSINGTTVTVYVKHSSDGEIRYFLTPSPDKLSGDLYGDGWGGPIMFYRA